MAILGGSSAGFISHKGNHGNVGGHRGRPYGLMLLLAFGAALIGVMALHKLRERRVFNLLVEEKNRQLISLQLLLQKEKEYTKEMKKKAVETKAKIYSLRNQKMELDHKMLEMQSTIDSLKDEQKTLESELEEKQNENKLLREKDINSATENRKVIALTATLKQKEAEIEVLKRRLTPPVKVWSVSTDDPSNPPVNITIMGSMEQREKTEFSHEEGLHAHESYSSKGSENSTKVLDENKMVSNLSLEEYRREGVENGNEKGEATLIQNKGTAAEMKNENSKHTDTSRNTWEKNHANATETIDDMNEQAKKRSFTGHPGELKNPQQGELQKLEENQEGEKRLEIDENSRISRLPGRHGHLSKAQGKRRKALARNRFLKNNVNSAIDESKSVRSRRFTNKYTEVVRRREEGAVSDEGKAERAATVTGAMKEMDDAKATSFMHHDAEDSEDMRQRKVNAEANHQVEGENEMPRNHVNSLAEEVPENTAPKVEANNHINDAKQIKVQEAAITKQNMNSEDFKELEKEAELNSIEKDDRDEVDEDLEAADKQEEEAEAANGDLANFMSDSEDKDGYKEEIDESEF